ncbi:hypothetical protein L3Q82_004256 [Scortum barcoo]|uniref:Uncharacterized protein n=1 Tax=Scortum barcoo TaxID=214431 RepID=A0ACB8VJ77_9TELE|nr:hypothetical protein L3Q82_004256 [Scortum barcoo]
MHICGLLEVILQGSGSAPPVPPCTKVEVAVLLLGCCPPTASSTSPDVLACLLYKKRHLSTTSNSQTPNSTMAKTKELSKDTRNKIVDLHQAGKTEPAIGTAATATDTQSTNSGQPSNRDLTHTHTHRAVFLRKMAGRNDMMKDFSLSLLSRGCGRFVSSSGNSGRHDGRLDVCFTPQDLVTMETSCESETRERKQRFVRHYSQQVGQQLSTLKELTAAILSYNQFNFSRLGPPLFPPLHLSLAPNLQHHPSPSPGYTTREKPSPELFVRSNPQWLPAEGNTEQLENQPEDKEEEPGSGRRVRLDLFLQIPSTSKTSTPQKEPQPWVHYVAMTPEEPEEPQFQLRLPSPSSDEHQRLPPIADCCTVAPSRAVQAQIQQDAPPKAERVGFQPQENLNQIHQQPLILPLLLPEEISGKQRGGKKTERQHFKKDTAGKRDGGGGGGRQPSEKVSVIQLETGEEPPPPVGVLGCVAGWKGPGKQSSLAFLQNRLLDLQDPCESSNANRGVVRDLQSDKSIGCLILGPDGEIIQLSLYEGSQNPSQGEGDTQEQEGGVELNTDAPVGHIQHRQSKHKTTEGLTSVGQFAEEECSFNAEQLIDHHRSTDAWSPRSHTDSVAATKRKTKTTVAGTWKEAKKDSKHKMRMPPLREHVGKEELRGRRH